VELKYLRFLIIMECKIPGVCIADKWDEHDMSKKQSEGQRRRRWK
jgi:hypothetical protein